MLKSWVIQPLSWFCEENLHNKQISANLNLHVHYLEDGDNTLNLVNPVYTT